MIGTFRAHVAPGGKVTLDFPAAVKAFLSRLAGTTGANLAITFADWEAEKTRAQEKGFHAMIRPWAAEIGSRVDDLKRELLEEIFGTMEVTHSLTGQVYLVLRKPHTSKLTKREYSELIEHTIEIAASRGYVLTPPEEYKAQHPEKYPEYARQQKRRAA